LPPHIRVLAAVIFRIIQVAISHEICQKNRIIVSVLICPFSKISPVWGYFESEPDTGFFWSVKGVIGGHIGPGLGQVCTMPARKTRWGRHPFPPVARKKTLTKIFRLFRKMSGSAAEHFQKQTDRELEDSGKKPVGYRRLL